MPDCAYRIALASRGAGAFAYSYVGPDGLVPGQLVAVRFRNRLELGVVVEPDPAPPANVELQPLLTVECKAAGWGGLLLKLSELACAAPHEMLPRLVLSGAAAGLRLELRLNPPLASGLPAGLLQCAGRLTPLRRRQLASADVWARAVDAQAAVALGIELDFAGRPGVSTARAALRHNYLLDAFQTAAHGLPAAGAAAWPGGYLAGLAVPPQLTSLPKAKVAVAARAGEDSSISSRLAWEAMDWPAAWNVCAVWPEIAAIPLRRAQCTLAELRSPDGLLADIAQNTDERVLLLAPQNWLLDSMWPLLAPLAPRLLRHHAAQPPSELAHLLHALGSGACRIAAGTEAAWRLLAYTRFDRVLLIDPSHPQWRPESSPWLDPRGAVLLAGSASGARLDLIELGLSAFDGTLKPALTIHPPHAPDATLAAPAASSVADVNPLPLKLREPDVRRLVYFNRLGSSRGLTCAECAAAVHCPRCRGRALHFSRGANAFRCPDCGLEERELRCPRCGLATLAARLPGLEAVRVRPGETVVGGANAVQPGLESVVVLGTAQLLEPPPGFWPQQVVYVDPEERELLDNDWRGALDMAARLAALYANPALAEVHIVSARLADRLVPDLPAVEAAGAARQEDKLRQLGGLPPYACLYRLRALAESTAPLAQARDMLGQALSRLPETAMLRLGQPFARQRRCELHGLLLNPQFGWEAGQQLRWEADALGVGLSINPLRGPWL